MENVIRLPQDKLAIEKHGCYFVEEDAQHAVDWIQEYCELKDGFGAGHKVVLMEWQQKLLRTLYGWKRENGTRRFRRVGVWIPKKNSKTMLSSFILMYELVCAKEQAPAVYSVGTDREMAGYVFENMHYMILADDELQGFLTPKVVQKVITHPGIFGKYKALASNSDRLQGLGANCIVLDELHAQKKQDLYDTLIYAGAGKAEPIFITISTAGYDRESIGYYEFQYANAVKNGTSNDWTFLPMVYALDSTDDNAWRKEENWLKVNPSMNVTMTMDDMREAYAMACSVPSKQNAFRRYRLNEWTSQSSRWLTMEDWDNCNSFEEADLLGKSCCIGVDLASIHDLTAITASFVGDDGNYPILPYAFLPEYNISQKAKRDKVDYEGWARDGYLTLTEGRTTDYEVVIRKILELNEKYDVREVVFDPHNANSMIARLQDEGITCTINKPSTQAMTGPSRFFEECIIGGKIQHNKHPVMNWCINNVEVVVNEYEEIRPHKPSETARIDCVVASILATYRARQAREVSCSYSIM